MLLILYVRFWAMASTRVASIELWLTTRLPEFPLRCPMDPWLTRLCVQYCRTMNQLLIIRAWNTWIIWTFYLVGSLMDSLVWIMWRSFDGRKIIRVPGPVRRFHKYMYNIWYERKKNKVYGWNKNESDQIYVLLLNRLIIIIWIIYLLIVFDCMVVYWGDKLIRCIIVYINKFMC